MSTWPFEPLRPLSYGLILADPPWHYVLRSEAGYGKSPESHYETMALADIQALPVGHLASRDCLLVMWSTWAHLEQALATMSAWGFTYKTGGAWTKRYRSGKAAFGTGYVLRSATEPFLLGTIGEPKLRSKSERNLIETEVDEDFPTSIEALRREHSRKPMEMREVVDRLCPEVFGLELFAREAWPGHDVWGLEADHFNDASEAAE
ncbi:MT-A70 family methyltransferase [Amorphus coralli]|uniref:MT-A70 family methyltransferase n=1 Tax=Amorphus coralli TaxID=340680 RepID=UPI00035CE4E4|nr:MT-A70 family methyltransferase [Amorphus coralli]